MGARGGRRTQERVEGPLPLPSAPTVKEKG